MHPEERENRGCDGKSENRDVDPAEPRPERLAGDDLAREPGAKPRGENEGERLVRAQDGNDRAAVDPDDQRRGSNEHEGRKGRVQRDRSGKREASCADDGERRRSGRERGDCDRGGKRG